MINALAYSISGVPVPGPNSIPQGGLFSPGTGQTTGQLIIERGIELLFLFAVLFALYHLVLAGIHWIMSEGDKQKVMAARDSIVHSVLGLMIVFLSYFIVFLVGKFFRINFFGP